MLTVTFLPGLSFFLLYKKQPTVHLNVYFLVDCFICGWDTTGREEYSVNWIMHGYRDTQSQGIKGMCKQLNKNKTLTAVWPIAGLLCTCKQSRWERWEGLQSWGASWAKRRLWCDSIPGRRGYKLLQSSFHLNTFSALWCPKYFIWRAQFSEVNLLEFLEA